MTPVVCPRCGRVFDAREDRWETATAAPGRKPGCLWLHPRPDNPRRSCAYVDAGEATAPERLSAGIPRRVA
ncbi:MAG TPA: hypothetical protein VIL85_11855 [Thermomicrobiales bacterium]